ncbi:MAG: hypothetical protein ABSG31_17335 [Tepidisphaeraceae bacterium]|jgi:hypothetical protein
MHEHAYRPGESALKQATLAGTNAKLATDGTPIGTEKGDKIAHVKQRH